MLFQLERASRVCLKFTQKAPNPEHQKKKHPHRIRVMHQRCEELVKRPHKKKARPAGQLHQALQTHQSYCGKIEKSQLGMRGSCNVTK